jgi:hypothetical protein
MHRFVPLLALVLTGAGLLAGNAQTGAPTGTTTASAPAPPPVDEARVNALVGKLTSSRYSVRRDARAELLRLVDLPGVAELLKAHLKTAKDPEVKASLENVLSGHDMPLAMVWYRGGLRELPRMGPAAWLFVRADGRFVIDKSSPLVTGKPPSSAVGDYRQGKLTRAEVFALKRLIRDSGQARGPSNTRVAYRSGWMQLSAYLRSGKDIRNWLVAWPVEAFRPGASLSRYTADVKLAAALGQFLAARPAKPYDGPVAMHVLLGGMIRGKVYTRQQVANIPLWQVPGLSVTEAKARTSGVVLSTAQLKRVRAALEKTDVYQYNKYIACQVFVAPHVQDAAEIQFGR